MRVFKDNSADKQFHEIGFVKHGLLDVHVVDDLNKLNEDLKIPDFIGNGYNVGMNSDDLLLRKKMNAAIIEIASQYALRYLDDFSAFTGSFMEKKPDELLFVKAHQDFTYTDYERVPSVVCWIPLIDTDIHNGTLGLIPYSHLFYNYIRAFPFPLQETPVLKNEITLMEYLEMVPLKAGEMVFFNNNTIHGSFSNYSNMTRLALGISFIKTGEQLLAYVHNPQTAGKTILKYEVDRDFIVNYNNTIIYKMYSEGHLDLPYEQIEEFPYESPDMSDQYLYSRLEKYGLSKQVQNIELLSKYKKGLRRSETKARIKGFFSKFQSS